MTLESVLQVVTAVAAFTAVMGWVETLAENWKVAIFWIGLCAWINPVGLMLASIQCLTEDVSPWDSVWYAVATIATFEWLRMLRSMREL